MNDAMLNGDVNPRSFAPRLEAAVNPIRRATEADIPFVRELAVLKYPARNVEQALNWFKWCLQSPDRLVLVGANSFGIAQVDWNYGFERRGRMDVLAGRAVPGASFETLRMIRMMVLWAKERGATGNFKIEADTGVDFGPFAKRLGGRQVTTVWYEIPLNESKSDG